MESGSSGKLFLGGTLGALAGAVGLVRLGTAPFVVFRDALLLRGGDPWPESLQHCGTLALCSLLFGIASAVAVVGLLPLTRAAHLDPLAQILLIASGAASAVGGAGLWLGATREVASLRVVATSESAPNPEQVSAAIEYALGPARVGFAGLLAGAVLLLALACNCLRDAPPRSQASGAARVVGGLSAASVIAFAFALVATWFPLHELVMTYDADLVWKPGQVAPAIHRTLAFSQLAAISLLVYGILVTLLGILLLRADFAKA